MVGIHQVGAVALRILRGKLVEPLRHLLDVTAFEVKHDVGLRLRTLHPQLRGAVARGNVVQADVVLREARVHRRDQRLVAHAFGTRVDDDGAVVRRAAAGQRQDG